MNQLIVRQQAAKSIHKGCLLIQQADLASELQGQAGEQVAVYDEKGNFLAMAYIGLQHKGVAWIYSRHFGELLDQQYFEQLMAQALQKRHQMMQDQATTAFRLFNGEGDGLGGLTIDYYANFLVCSYYSQGMYSYRKQIVATLIKLMTNINGIYEKIRFSSDESLNEKLDISRHVYGQLAPEPHLVKENHLTYATYLNEGLMTGIFLDQREVRAIVRDRYSQGKRVLNTFSYTGAFSVAAAAGGAVQTVSVDVANRSREKTLEQFAVNHLTDTNPAIYVMDVFDYVTYAQKKQLQFDVIVVDPPSFARTKKRTFSVVKDYGTFLQKLVPLAAPHAVFILSTNAANLSHDAFRNSIEQALNTTNRAYRLERCFHLPDDFAIAPSNPSSDYLKVWIVQMEPFD